MPDFVVVLKVKAIDLGDVIVRTDKLAQVMSVDLLKAAPETKKPPTDRPRGGFRTVRGQGAAPTILTLEPFYKEKGLKRGEIREKLEESHPGQFTKGAISQGLTKLVAAHRLRKRGEFYHFVQANGSSA